MMQDINKNILVTASSKGLGLAIAQKFSENGYGVIIHGRNEEKIDLARKKVDNVLCTIKGDLTDEDTIEQLTRSSDLHNICVLVNNAAIPCYGQPLQEMTEEQINLSLSVNLISPIILTNKIYPIISRNSPGAIININSIVGIEPKMLRSIHSATKWGLRGFSQSLRLEASENNIRVFNVYPTRIKTVSEYAYGLEPSFVASKIYEEYETNSYNYELIIDGRPEEFKPKETYDI
tara:strand:- start:474 stop:1175 length:702 start_codon:yes stop_codon:yes gene_type:complete